MKFVRDITTISECDSANCKIIDSLKAKMFDMSQEILRLKNLAKRCNSYIPIEWGLCPIDKCAICGNTYSMGHKENCDYLMLFKS